MVRNYFAAKETRGENYKLIWLCILNRLFDRYLTISIMSDATAQVISFPLPPAHYIKLFTNDNVTKGFTKPPSANLIENYSMFG